MASNLAIRVMPEPIRSLNYTALSGSSYVGIGAAFENPVHWYDMVNNTDGDLMISWDGIKDHQFLPARGYMVMDVASNKTTNAGTFMVSQGTRFYVREVGGSPTSGDVYLSIFYGFQNF